MDKIDKLQAKFKELEKLMVQVRADTDDNTETSVSPLAPKDGFPDLPLIDGVELSSIEAGVHYSGRTDVMLANLCPGTAIAGVFTKSATRAAPVLDCQEKLGSAIGGGAAFIVNSGNANAFTGSGGQKAVEKITEAVAKTLDVPQERVFSASTGVIGQPLPHDKITKKLTALKDGLAPDHIHDAAMAIMTTDTFAKGASAVVATDDGPIHISGIAKGSGMIAPDMATMLAYIFTDAKIEQPLLQKMLSSLTEKTFNCITVDSDTSTSDTVMLAATGKSKADEITDMHGPFYAVLHKVMRELSHLVVKDGEGATKFIEVRVTGADSDDDARKVAMSIANSPLVKTAFAGEDPNWGRVVMAVGKSGAKADRDLLSIRIGNLGVAEKGWIAPNYNEELTAKYMHGDELQIAVDLGIGDGRAKVWTCDLTHDYIKINTNYRS